MTSGVTQLLLYVVLCIIGSDNCIYHWIG